MDPLTEVLFDHDTVLNQIELHHKLGTLQFYIKTSPSFGYPRGQRLSQILPPCLNSSIYIRVQALLFAQEVALLLLKRHPHLLVAINRFRTGNQNRNRNNPDSTKVVWEGP